MEQQYEELIKQLKSCVFTVISPELAGEAATVIQLLAERIDYYENLKKEGRLIVLSVEDIYPCKNCGIGWGSATSEGCDGCENYCERLREYNKKYNT